MPVVQTFNLTKKYKKLTAVDNLNISIEKGEVFGLLGPNGAGKTTIIKMLITLLKPTSGTAKINGFDVIKEPEKVRESIGVVFQDPSSDDLLTGYENLKLYSMMYGIPNNEIKRRIDEAFELVELTDRKNDIVKRYSGGMRRRLEIARGLIHRPEILFLDEPTIGLDPRGMKNMWNYIKLLAQELKITVFLTTHYMEEADTLANRVGIIDRGKIVILDSPGALKKIVGGDLVTIKATCPNIEDIKRLKFVKGIKNENSEILITVENAAENLQQILKIIGSIESVQVRTPTLNDVFLHFTGRGIQEEGDEPWLAKAAQESGDKA